jgi:hypothetical protein
MAGASATSRAAGPTAAQLEFRHRLSTWGMRLVVPGFLGYALYTMRPKEAHFIRYLDERRRYEADFAARLNHPKSSITFEEHLLWGVGVAKMPTLKSMLSGGGKLMPTFVGGAAESDGKVKGGIGQLKTGWNKKDGGDTQAVDEFDSGRPVEMEENRFFGLFGVFWYQTQ